LEFAQIAAAATASRQRRPVLSNQISTASTLSAASAASAGQSRGAATGVSQMNAMWKKWKIVERVNIFAGFL
jgi:hypothetical protein